MMIMNTYIFYWKSRLLELLLTTCDFRKPSNNFCLNFQSWEINEKIVLDLVQKFFLNQYNRIILVYQYFSILNIKEGGIYLGWDSQAL